MVSLTSFAMKKSDRGISSDAVDGNKTKVDLPVGKKKPPSQMSKLGGRNGMQQQGTGTSGVPQVGAVLH